MEIWMPLCKNGDEEESTWLLCGLRMAASRPAGLGLCRWPKNGPALVQG